MREDWQNLASYVLHDRVALGYRTRPDFAEASAISKRTLGDLETGRRVSKTTLGLAELALRWAPGSALRVLAGGEPIRLGTAQPEDGVADSDPQEGETELLEASLEELIRMRRVIARVKGVVVADDFLRNAVRIQEEIRARSVSHGA